MEDFLAKAAVGGLLFVGLLGIAVLQAASAAVGLGKKVVESELAQEVAKEAAGSWLESWWSSK